MTAGKYSILFIMLIAFFLAACSSGDDSNTAAKTEPAQPSGEEILEQAAAAINDVQSFMMDKTEEINLETTAGYSQQSTESGWMIIETEPFVMHSRSVKNGKENLMYIKENYSYLYNPLKQTWNKADIASDETASQNAELLKEPFKIQAEQMINMADEIDVTESDDTYELKATADSSKAESTLEQLVGLSSSMLEDDAQTEFEKFHFTAVIDKTTQLPQHIMIDTEIKITEGTESTVVQVLSDVSYNDYDETDKITLSEDAANARDVTEERKTWY